MREWYKSQSKKAPSKKDLLERIRKMKAFNLLQKPGRMAIVKKASRLLGKFIPPVSIALMIWGSYDEAQEIADKLTKNEIEALRNTERDIEIYGADPVTAHIVNQLATFARSPGTKF